VESDRGTPAVACSLGHQELAQRAALWKSLAARAAGQVSPTENGLRLIFGAGQGTASELRRLVALERDCCPFAAWSVAENDGHLVVDISADSPAAVGAVRAMFGWLSSPR
jgi:hypothetical protein